MHQAQLSASQMATMRSLLRQEPVPGQPVPEQHTFELLAALGALRSAGGRCSATATVTPWAGSK